MNDLINEMNAYLGEVIGLKVEYKALRVNNVPIYISETYSFCALRVGNSKFLGVLILDPENFKTSAFEKHKRYFPELERDYEGIVLIANQLSGFVRKRLVEMKIPFVIPKVQLYWPELGLEFRNFVKNKVTTKESVEKFDPAAQAVLIGALNNIYEQPITPKELSERLLYSAMSMTRALDQIESAEIAEIEKSGKKRLLSFPNDKQSLWQNAMPKLINPVREKARFYEDDVPAEYKLKAGESALSEMSMLVAPRTNTYAVDREKWKKIQKQKIPNLELSEPYTCEVQVWRYDPELFADRNCVDVFSLYLSFEDVADERIEMALEEALETKL
tara:strand:- start:1441 stop:2433 length:993 start_codon:yes stop_codon:yes gene_type:complete